MVGAVAGRLDHLDAQIARLDHVAAGERLVHLPSLQELLRLLVSQDRHAEPLRELLHLEDVVPVVVGQDDMRDLGALALGALGQRIGDAVRVDEHAVPARLVDHEVRVGQPLGLLDSLQDQCRLPFLSELDNADRMPSWASISSKPLFTSSSEMRCEMNGSTSMSPAR